MRMGEWVMWHALVFFSQNWSCVQVFYVKDDFSALIIQISLFWSTMCKTKVIFVSFSFSRLFIQIIMWLPKFNLPSWLLLSILSESVIVNVLWNAYRCSYLLISIDGHIYFTELFLKIMMIFYLRCVKTLFSDYIYFGISM